ncbi:aspartyl-phosphate phosphatase Spo0E family protein [Sutcliffiella deserti]|uniref:aspartyl-phosphate phosphatase Spo0E family protein n=1 Tax=Sutcliffiella deserti TaxID=2875501 RepID=UPI001CBB2B66|nr:aspartyl-phosphate phosphatase Spo0E family protein [Sutcliffiella deserti]
MLSLRIEVKRKQMIQYANKYGFTSYKTIKCSQELDTLLNKQWKELNPLSQTNHYFYTP